MLNSKQVYSIDLITMDMLTKDSTVEPVMTEAPTVEPVAPPSAPTVAPPVEPPILESCLIEGEQYYDPFWFVSDGFFTDDEILQRCNASIEPVQPENNPATLYIECDWTRNEDDALRGKGRAYMYVEKACNEKGGLMFAAHYLKTVHEYSPSATVNAIETSEHYNVPVCLAPSRCDPEEVLHEVTPCSQFDKWYPFDKDGQSWTYGDTTDSECTTDSILAATYMDEECENKLTYLLYDESDSTCRGEYTDDLYVCDFSDFTEVGGSEYNSDLCDDANQYKYSYGLDGDFLVNGVPISARHYFLNNPTCLKEGCDVESYFYKNLIPYHSFEWFKGEREKEQILTTTGVQKRNTEQENEKNPTNTGIQRRQLEREDVKILTTTGMGILLLAA